MEPRSQLEWTYGTILGDRDICEHDFVMLKNNPFGSTEHMVKIYADKMEPFQGDMKMLDFSTENMYSEHIAKLVSWHRYYTRFWKQSALYCNWRWPDFFNQYGPNQVGSTGIGEPKFLNAVTGKNLTFIDGIKLGRRIWNLDHAIWTLQGRHRDMVHFADYLYTQPGRGRDVYLPVLEDGKWKYVNTLSRHFDRNKFEEFKSRFYKLQGWETSTGYPLESTLKSQGLDFVANELKEKGTLGKG
jgi:aldehyde:ferredoxin oxidoreductase